MAFPRVKVTPATSGTDINTLPDAGQRGKADSLSVVIASDQGPLSVQGTITAHVDFTTPQHVIIDSMPAGGAATDVTDRSGRLLGHVTVDNASIAVTGTFWQATQPVSGTFWQATQPVSLATNTPDVTDRSGRLLGHVTVDNAALAVTGTFFQATQPVSVAALPLPSGAATSAKQPALGTAGTASADVLSVQGIAAMTALKVDGSGVTQPVSGTFWQATQPVSGTFWQATQPVSGTFWQATQPISAASLPLPSGASTSAKQPALGTAGTASADVLSVQGIAAMTALKVDGSAVTQPVSAASLPLPSGAATSAKQPALGTAGTPSADVLTVQGATAGTALKVDGSAVTQPVSGTVTANAGTNLNTSALATSANLTAGTAKTQVTDGTNTAAVKAASTAPAATDPALVVSLSPNMGPVSNSLLPSAAATINATVVKASAGRLYKIKGYNAKASVVYLKFWNKATTPAPASDTALIIFSFALKASDQFDIDLTPVGYAFASGIGYTLSTGSANNDATAVLAADVVGLNILYA